MVSQRVFHDLDPTLYRRRYRLQVVAIEDDCSCEHHGNNALCLVKTLRACCICGTPTCLEHERRPAYQSCVIHAGQPRPGGGLCCVCLTCAALDRDLQEQVYQ